MVLDCKITLKIKSKRYKEHGIEGWKITFMVFLLWFPVDSESKIGYWTRFHHAMGMPWLWWETFYLSKCNPSRARAICSIDDIWWYRIIMWSIMWVFLLWFPVDSESKIGYWTRFHHAMGMPWLWWETFYLSKCNPSRARAICSIDDIWWYRIIMWSIMWVFLLWFPVDSESKIGYWTRFHHAMGMPWLWWETFYLSKCNPSRARAICSIDDRWLYRIIMWSIMWVFLLWFPVDSESKIGYWTRFHHAMGMPWLWWETFYLSKCNPSRARAICSIDAIWWYRIIMWSIMWVFLLWFPVDSESKIGYWTRFHHAMGMPWLWWETFYLSKCNPSRARAICSIDDIWWYRIIMWSIMWVFLLWFPVDSESKIGYWTRFHHAMGMPWLWWETFYLSKCNPSRARAICSIDDIWWYRIIMWSINVGLLVVISCRFRIQDSWKCSWFQVSLDQNSQLCGASNSSDLRFFQKGPGMKQLEGVIPDAPPLRCLCGEKKTVLQQVNLQPPSHPDLFLSTVYKPPSGELLASSFLTAAEVLLISWYPKKQPEAAESSARYPSVPMPTWSRALAHSQSPSHSQPGSSIVSKKPLKTPTERRWTRPTEPHQTDPGLQKSVGWD